MAQNCRKALGLLHFSFFCLSFLFFLSFLSFLSFFFFSFTNGYTQTNKQTNVPTFSNPNPLQTSGDGLELLGHATRQRKEKSNQKEAYCNQNCANSNNNHNNNNNNSRQKREDYRDPPFFSFAEPLPRRHFHDAASTTPLPRRRFYDVASTTPLP